MIADVLIEPVDPQWARVRPKVRLGPLSWEKYVRATKAARCSFDRAKKLTTIPLERVDYLRRCLEDAGFRPIHDPVLKQHFATSALPVPQRDPSLHLRPFQEVGRDTLARNRRWLLADDMGVGKSCQALMAIPDRAPVVVCCPAGVKGVWRLEGRAWRPELLVSLYSGSGSFRWPMRGEIAVVNYDILPDGISSSPLPGTVVIADEAHYIKNEDARRTRRFRALADAAFASGGALHALTGTPLLNRPDELWNILDALGLATVAFGTWENFARLHDLKDKGGKTTWGDVSPEVPRLLQRVMLRRRRRDVWPEIPPKVYRELLVENLPARTKAMCDELVKKLAERGIDLSRAAAKVDLAQIETFELPLISKVRAALATAKIPVLMEQVELMEAGGEPLVVFSCHREPILALEGRPGWAVITGDVHPNARTEIVAAFQAGKLRGVASTIFAGGTGITLTHGHQVVMVDLYWTPGINLQAEDRVCRRGQNRGVVVQRIVADHEFDRRVTQILSRKQELIEDTVDAAAVEPSYGLDADGAVA